MQSSVTVCRSALSSISSASSTLSSLSSAPLTVSSASSVLSSLSSAPITVSSASSTLSSLSPAPLTVSSASSVLSSLSPAPLTVSSASSVLSSLSPAPLTVSSASSTLSSLSSAPITVSSASSTLSSLTTPESPQYILQPCSSDGFPIVSSVFSLQGVQPTALAATESNRTTLTGQHSKNESNSSGKKRIDVKNTPIKPMPLYVSSLKLHERQLSSFHECTLLKFVERKGGFFNGKQFTTSGLKGIFTTLQSYRLKLTFQELMKKCYILFEKKMKKLERSEIKVFLEVLDSFLYLFDWYCHKTLPVITVAMCVYLPNSIDYSFHTWHGVCPTGWSEYSCTVIIREVIQFILVNAKVSPTLPLYSPDYFSLPSLYSPKLLPRLLSTAQNLFDDTPCGSTDLCNIAKQESEVSNRSCTTEGTGAVEACVIEDTEKVRDAMTQTPQSSKNSTLQTSASPPFRWILPKPYSNPGSSNTQLNTVTCKDCAFSNCEPELQDGVNDVVSCKRDIDMGSPEKDVSSDCHNSCASSNSLKIADANLNEKPDETHCLDDVNVAMTTTKKQEETRKRDYFSCFLDNSNEGQNAPNKHIKIRIKQSSEDDLYFNEPGKFIHLSVGSNIKALGNQTSSDDAQMDSARLNKKINEDTTDSEIGDEQRDRDERKEFEDGEGKSKLVGTAPQKVDDVGCDVTESDVIMAESQVTIESESRGHVSETIDEVFVPANQQSSSATVAQSSPSKELLSVHCLNNDDNQVFTTEVTCKRSRLFDALWSNRTPFEPRIHMSSGSCMSLREFLERYPLATTCIPPGTIIEIDSNTYKADEVLNHFYTGVTFLCHSLSKLSSRRKICYSLDTIEDSMSIVCVKPTHRSSIKAVIPKTPLPAPHQNIYDEVCTEKSLIYSPIVTNKEKIKTQNDCNHGDGNTKASSSNLQGNTQPTKDHLPENRTLIQQINHLRKTANFLNELASGLEARLASSNDKGK